MNDDALFSKTSAGQDVLRTRAALPPRLRSLLIMIDGVRRAGELRHAAATIGAPVDAIETLLAMGLIGSTTAAAAPAPPTQTPLQPALQTPTQTPLQPALQTPTMPGGQASSTSVERFRVAKKFMNDTVVDALGIRAFMFTLELEKCAVLADLAGLLPKYVRLISKARGEQVAGALETRLRELLS